MHVVHGTWIPDDTEEFVQSGGFYLWVETDTPSRPKRDSTGGALHPRQLIDASLVAFLGEKLGIRDTYAETISRALCCRFFLLPSANGAPLPSLELQHYVEEEIPDAFELISWQLCCYAVPDVIRTLNDIHFVALNAAEDFQLGADFLFWYQFSRVIKQVIARASSTFRRSSIGRPRRREAGAPGARPRLSFIQDGKSSRVCTRRPFRSTWPRYRRCAPWDRPPPSRRSTRRSRFCATSPSASCTTS